MAGPVGEYGFAGCNTLTALNELIHDATVSRLGGRKIHLLNGEDVSIDVIKNKYAELLLNNRDENPSLQDLPALFARWEQEIKAQAEPIALLGPASEAALGAGARPAERNREPERKEARGAAAGAGARPSNPELEEMERQGLFLGEAQVQALDHALDDVQDFGIFYVNNPKFLGTLIGCHFEQMTPQTFANAMHYLKMRLERLANEDPKGDVVSVKAFFNNLLSRQGIWPEKASMLILNRDFDYKHEHKWLILARAKALANDQTRSVEEWNQTLNSARDVFGPNSSEAKEVLRLFQATMPKEAPKTTKTTREKIQWWLGI